MIKRELITKFFKARLQVAPLLLDEIVNDIHPICRLQLMSKYQILETPGPANGGRVWLSDVAMAHSYYFCEANGNNVGRRIYKKMEPMFYASSLIDNVDRDCFLQMLEPGWVLSAAYEDVFTIRGKFKDIREYIDGLSRENTLYAEHRIVLLNGPAPFQVKRFEDENDLFTKIASKEVRAMHLGICRHTYNTQLKKIITS